MHAARDLRCRVMLTATAFALLSLPLARPAETAAEGLIDINRATISQLETLPGIRAAWAQAIVKNRPYKNKSQLLTRKILPFTAYKAIKEKIIAKQ